jgi:hypothetical protein
VVVRSKEFSVTGRDILTVYNDHPAMPKAMTFTGTRPALVCKGRSVFGCKFLSFDFQVSNFATLSHSNFLKIGTGLDPASHRPGYSPTGDCQELFSSPIEPVKTMQLHCAVFVVAAMMSLGVLAAPSASAAALLAHTPALGGPTALLPDQFITSDSPPITSPNGAATLRLDPDGDLILAEGPTQLWSTGASHAVCTVVAVQGDACMCARR